MAIKFILFDKNLYLPSKQRTTMKKFIFGLILGLIAGTPMFAQFDLEWGTAEEVGNPQAAYDPIGMYEGSYYTLQFAKGDGLLIEVDKNNNIVGQKPLVTSEKKFESELTFKRGDKIVIINSDYDSKTKLISVFGTTYSFDGKLLTPKPKLLTTIKVEKNNESNDVVYRLSADSSKLAIIEDHNMPDKEDSKFSVAVITTDDLKEMWNSSFTAPYDDRDFQLLSNAVDNKGNMLLMSVIRGGEGKRLEKYSTRMFTIAAGSKTYEDQELKIEGKYISSAFINFANDGKLLITGFYNDLTSKGKDEGIEGAFMCISEVSNLGNPDLRMRKIDPSTKAAITPTGGWAKAFGADELNTYFIKDIQVRPDGSGYVIAEQRYVTITYGDNLQTRTYNFNHLIVYNFDANQDITYISTIPKYQSTTASVPYFLGVSIWTGSMTRYCHKYNSFRAIEKEGNIYIMYNDHRDNGDARTMKEAERMTNKNKANGVIVTVDANGKWEKEAMFVGKDIDVILETSSSYLIPGVGFIISAERKKDVQYGTVVLK